MALERMVESSANDGKITRSPRAEINRLKAKDIRREQKTAFALDGF